VKRCVWPTFGTAFDPSLAWGSRVAAARTVRLVASVLLLHLLVLTVPHPVVVLTEP